MPETDLEQRAEGLSAHASTIQLLLTQSEHLFHNRPGVWNTRTSTWSPVKVVEVEGVKRVLDLSRKKPVDLGAFVAPAGVSGRPELSIRAPGIVPEVAGAVYGKVYEIWQQDRDFVAHLASWAAKRDHQDMRSLLSAFMLNVPDAGDPVHQDDGTVAFYKEDHRAVGEAVFLLPDIKTNARQLLQIHDILTCDEVARINIEMQGKGTHRKPPMGRYLRLVKKWLRYREHNPHLLRGLVDRANFGRTVRKLARLCGYRPTSPEFFRALNWKQAQAKDGRREIAIGEEMAQTGWDHLSEEEVCGAIVEGKVGYKRMITLVPAELGVTRAMLMACIESGGVSDPEIIIMQPRLEELGLAGEPAVRAQLERALKRATNMRAAHIAERVQDEGLKKALQEGAEGVAKASAARALKDLYIVVGIDVSGSMHGSLEEAKRYLAKLLPAFPEERVKVYVFNSAAQEVTFQSRNQAGVGYALSRFGPGGMTDYSAPLYAFERDVPNLPDGVSKAALFVGDQGDPAHNIGLDRQLKGCDLGPDRQGHQGYDAVFMVNVGTGQKRIQQACARAQIPYIELRPEHIEDIYALPRVLSDLIYSTPVATPDALSGRPMVPAVNRQTKLIKEILETPLLQKPAWAA